MFTQTPLTFLGGGEDGKQSSYKILPIPPHHHLDCKNTKPENMPFGPLAAGMRSIPDSHSCVMLIVIPRLLRGYNIALSPRQTQTRHHLRRAQFYPHPSFLYQPTKMYKFSLLCTTQRTLETKATISRNLSTQGHTYWWDKKKVHSHPFYYPYIHSDGRCVGRSRAIHMDVMRIL